MQVVYNNGLKRPWLATSIPSTTNQASYAWWSSCAHVLPTSRAQVTFGAHPADGAAAVALLRTGGIVLGVLVFMALSVLVLPKSASMESLRWGSA